MNNRLTPLSITILLLLFLIGLTLVKHTIDRELARVSAANPNTGYCLIAPLGVFLPCAD